MDVLPAFARPIISTRNWILGIRLEECSVFIAWSIGAIARGKSDDVDRFVPTISHDLACGTVAELYIGMSFPVNPVQFRRTTCLTLDQALPSAVAVAILSS